MTIHALKHPAGDIWCDAPAAGTVTNVDISKATCVDCLYYITWKSFNDQKEKAAYKRAQELAGGVIHAPNGFNYQTRTHCSKPYPGCSSWRRSTCLDCLDAGTKSGSQEAKSRAAELRDRGVGWSPGRFPNKCPHCGAAAYVGFSMVDCFEGMQMKKLHLLGPHGISCGRHIREVISTTSPEQVTCAACLRVMARAEHKKTVVLG